MHLIVPSCTLKCPTHLGWFHFAKEHIDSTHVSKNRKDETMIPVARMKRGFARAFTVIVPTTDVNKLSYTALKLATYLSFSPIASIRGPSNAALCACSVYSRIAITRNCRFDRSEPGAYHGFLFPLSWLLRMPRRQTACAELATTEYSGANSSHPKTVKDACELVFLVSSAAENILYRSDWMRVTLNEPNTSRQSIFVTDSKLLPLLHALYQFAFFSLGEGRTVFLFWFHLWAA